MRLMFTCCSQSANICVRWPSAVSITAAACAVEFTRSIWRSRWENTVAGSSLASRTCIGSCRNLEVMCECKVFATLSRNRSTGGGATCRVSCDTLRIIFWYIIQSHSLITRSQLRCCEKFLHRHSQSSMESSKETEELLLFTVSHSIYQRSYMRAVHCDQILSRVGGPFVVANRA